MELYEQRSEAVAGKGRSEKSLKSIQVVKLSKTGEVRYSLDEEALSGLLLREDVRDRCVVVVSVAGQVRSGKSFLLDLFLRYLSASRASQLSGEWLSNERENWQGFEYRGGCERHTTGIHLWPEPILVDQDDGQKVAIFLMDTQGTFDHDSTLADDSMIFALSMLMSSVQIYNLRSNIKEDDLQVLQVFTEYGQLVSDGQTFQELLFLVRDWMYDFEEQCGFTGGESVLNKRLQPHPNQTKELPNVCEHIRSCFESIQCFLMPHPGLKIVCRNSGVKDLSEKFRNSLRELVPALFEPKKLFLKRINGHPVKAKYLLDLFKKYVAVFNGDALPDARTIFEATVEMRLLTILNESRDVYEERMASHLRDEASVPPSRMQHWHEVSVTAAVNAFNSQMRLGPQEAIDATLAQLRTELESRFSIYSLQNETKSRKSIAGLAGTSSQNEEPRLSGIQVVKLSETGNVRYELDEEALSGLLLREDVRDRSVVLVSVAGQFRRGKSFLLGLFLRYLKAPRSSQLSGEWLSTEREEWEGFEYRGGGDRHTTGIHLWPEPVLVDLDDGQKVAVLLMDTQGTFDQESTLADNSMIFALSTLMSSVQIYNLLANIGEDDLQHLQLFSEYGRLASGRKAFQTLLFLVRDWMHDKQHSWGFAGGEDLLNKRLQPQPNQKEELRKVREHIKSCFEAIKCFLMPFPGSMVARGIGGVKDLEEDFQIRLQELVPALFDPKNLIPKRINGNPVKAKYLLDLFKKYVDVFNSNALPEAKTVLEATAETWLLSILSESREVYEERMTSYLRDDKSVPPSRMQHWHEISVTAAVDAFNSQMTLGPQEAVDTTLAQLRRELESKFSLYTLQNDTKTRKSFAEAKELYQSVIDEVCEAQTKLCLHPRDLERLHRQALADALEFFNSKRNPGCEDVESIRLEQELRALYQQLSTINEQNNSTAKMQARERYFNKMRTYLSDSGVSTEYLMTQHVSEKANTLRYFDAQRNLPTEQPQDSYREELINDVEDTFRELKTRNANSNRIAMQVAEHTYNNYITNAWGPQSSCFHPRALAEMHETAKDEAMTQFLAERPESENDEFKDRLARTLVRRYELIQQINTANNEDAALLSWNEYTRLMDKWTQPGLISILVVPFVYKVFVRMPKYQKRAKEAAMVVWNSKRRGRKFAGDTHFTDLTEKIDNAYKAYRDPLLAIIKEVGIDPDPVNLREDLLNVATGHTF